MAVSTNMTITRNCLHKVFLNGIQLDEYYSQLDIDVQLSGTVQQGDRGLEVDGMDVTILSDTSRQNDCIAGSHIELTDNERDVATEYLIAEYQDNL